MKSSPDDPANTRSNGPNLVSGTLTVGRAGAQVADTELAAGERVRDRDVGGAVIGDQLFDADPMAAVIRDRATEEAGRGCRLLVLIRVGSGRTAPHTSVQCRLAG